MREDQLYAAGEAQMRLVSWAGEDAVMVTLPHSCDGWKIGYREHMQQLIDDLTSLLSVVPPSPQAEVTREAGDA